MLRIRQIEKIIIKYGFLFGFKYCEIFSFFALIYIQKFSDGNFFFMRFFIFFFLLILFFKVNHCAPDCSEKYDMKKFSQTIHRIHNVVVYYMLLYVYKYTTSHLLMDTLYLCNKSDTNNNNNYDNNHIDIIIYTWENACGNRIPNFFFFL